MYFAAFSFKLSKMDILIIRISAIGDVLHTFPAAKLIQQTVPQARLHWVVQKKAAALLQDQPFLHSVLLLPDKPLHFKNWSSTFKVILQLYKKKWDAIIDFQGILKSFILMAPLRGKKFGFSYHHARSKLISFATDYHINPEPAINVIQKNLALASGALLKIAPEYKASPTIQELSKNFPFVVPQIIKKNVDDWFEKNKILHPIILSPNTTWDSKHWPTHHWKKLVQILLEKQTSPIVLLGTHLQGQAAALASLKIPSLHIAPTWDLQATAHALTHAQLVIAPDTGILHLADAVGAPTIGLFGPTSPKIHGPILHDHNAKNNLCIPCSHFYKKQHDSFDCMASLKPEKLAEEILKQTTNYISKILNAHHSFLTSIK